MKEEDHINVILSMIFALTCPSKRNNQLFSDTLPKIHRNEESNNDKRTKFYAIKGQEACYSAFAAITQVSVSTLEEHGRAVSNLFDFKH